MFSSCASSPHHPCSAVAPCLSIGRLGFPHPPTSRASLRLCATTRRALPSAAARAARLFRAVSRRCRFPCSLPRHAPLQRALRSSTTSRVCHTFAPCAHPLVPNTTKVFSARNQTAAAHLFRLRFPPPRCISTARKVGTGPRGS
ncbi:hypothetical protein PAHAL_8G152100 [Panicum hallii]|uniref:Uncharacterized protein n=1 Tax=Panicum hallii TaxID=206008 RepID=A0A2T8I8Y9_9POAL|nr:hypothetical protein PAHAL_8G152100 [Panicum hallii]